MFSDLQIAGASLALTTALRGLAACLPLVLLTLQSTHAQPIQWQAVVGGSSDDYLFAVVPTSDGGYAFAGSSYSDDSGNKVSPGHGNADFWVVKLDDTGNKQWDRTFGGTDFDEAYTMQPTGDGGLLIGGISDSGMSGNKTTGTHGNSDYWIVKTDSDGNKEWEKNFGGTDNDELFVVRPSGNGEYYLLGASASGMTGNKTTGNLGSYDYWLVKLDADGNKVWERVFGGDDDDYPYALESTSDGGCILGGSSASGSSGNKDSGNFGDYDYWIVKVDSDGNKQWESVFGGTGWDEVTFVKQTSDEGYIIAGSSESGISGNKGVPNFGLWDWWLIKLDKDGNKVWEKIFGGSDGNDYLNVVEETSDGGYALAGTAWSNSSGNKAEDNVGESDFWLVKVDGDGDILSQRVIGGTDQEYPWIMHVGNDGSYLLAGHSNSGVSGDKAIDGFGMLDGWIVKLSPEEPAMPRLTIAQATANGVVVRWPVSATGFSIQESTNLNTANWSAPTETLNQDGTNYSITFDPPGGNRYFRLFKP